MAYLGQGHLRPFRLQLFRPDSRADRARANMGATRVACYAFIPFWMHGMVCPAPVGWKRLLAALPAVAVCLYPPALTTWVSEICSLSGSCRASGPRCLIPAANYLSAAGNLATHRCRLHNYVAKRIQGAWGGRSGAVSATLRRAPGDGGKPYTWAPAMTRHVWATCRLCSGSVRPTGHPRSLRRTGRLVLPDS